MWMKRLLGVLLLLVLAACNLQAADAPVPTSESIPSPVLPETVIPSPTGEGTLDATLPARTLAATPNSIDQLLTPNRPASTLVPTRLPGSGATNVPAPNASVLGQNCPVYVVYSGSDPANVISLRAQPSAASPQVMRVPNNMRVYLVPGTQEVEAEGYHWLNIVYVDAAQNRYQGWAARDSFMQSGIRDTSIQTLRPTGEQSPC